MANLSRHLGLTGMALGMAVSLSACGGDGAGSTSSSGADTAAINALLTKHYGHPECAELTTRGRTAFGHPVDDASCATDIAKQSPTTVTVSGVMVRASSATAKAVDADGGRFFFELKKVNGTWLIDGGHG